MKQPKFALGNTSAGSPRLG